MNSSTINEFTKTRETKYCRAILNYLYIVGHATNIEILNNLRTTYPDLSPTTVHRATVRLANRNEIKHAPPDLHGSMRYDANTSAHDHFMCRSCGILRDTNIANSVKPLIESQLQGCQISGDIVVSGICKACAANI